MRTTALLYHDVVPANDYHLSGFQSPDADIYKLDFQEVRQHFGEIAAQPQGAPQDVTGGDLDGPGRRLLLTFDDGGVSAILYTADLLEERGWIGHFFITTDYIGKAGFLDESQLRALRRRKHVIGSHSCSHPPRMAACSTAQLNREWHVSRMRLEDILGEAVTTASVPGGYYSRQVARTAAAAGIHVLFNSEPITTIGVADGCRIIGRFCVKQGTSAQWVSAVVRNQVLPRARSYLAWNSKKLLKAAGGTAWLAARKMILANRTGSGKRRDTSGR